MPRWRSSTIYSANNQCFPYSRIKTTTKNPNTNFSGKVTLQGTRPGWLPLVWINPHWVKRKENVGKSATGTRFSLRLKGEVRAGAKTIAVQKRFVSISCALYILYNAFDLSTLLTLLCNVYRAKVVESCNSLEGSSKLLKRMELPNQLRRLPIPSHPALSKCFATMCVIMGILYMLRLTSIFKLILLCLGASYFRSLKWRGHALLGKRVP